MPDLSDDQKSKLEAIRGKVEKREALSEDDVKFLEASKDAFEGIPAEEEVSE